MVPRYQHASKWEKVTLHFSDYGTCNVVDINDIRLDLALEEKPVQVLHCSLYKLNQLEADTTQEWKVEHVEEMREAVMEREFRVVVKALAPPIQVMIYPKI